MVATAGLRDGFGEPGASCSERIPGHRESDLEGQSPLAPAAIPLRTHYPRRDRKTAGTENSPSAAIPTEKACPSGCRSVTQIRRSCIFTKRPTRVPCPIRKRSRDSTLILPGAARPKELGSAAASSRSERWCVRRSATPSAPPPTVGLNWSAGLKK